MRSGARGSLLLLRAGHEWSKSKLAKGPGWFTDPGSDADRRKGSQCRRMCALTIFNTAPSAIPPQPLPATGCSSHPTSEPTSDHTNPESVAYAEGGCPIPCGHSAFSRLVTTPRVSSAGDARHEPHEWCWMIPHSCGSCRASPALETRGVVTRRE